MFILYDSYKLGSSEETQTFLQRSSLLDFLPLFLCSCPPQQREAGTGTIGGTDRLTGRSPDLARPLLPQLSCCPMVARSISRRLPESSISP